MDGDTLGVRHDFGGGAEENAVGGGFLGYSGTIVLQWADPLGASSNDYDLFLVDANGDVFASSTNTQDGTQDPMESISTGFFAYDDARLVVVKASGADRYLRLQAFGGQLEIATAGNASGHAAAENAFGVAAVDVGTAGGAGGVFDGTESVHTTSSDGPRRVFFEADGTPITAGDFSATGGRLLQKPDLAAATCVSTATPGFSRFCGTSSAAPHAAALAALMLQAAGGPARFSLAQLRKALAEAALDIEAAGVDRDAGAGIVMAARAVDAVDVAAADRNRAPAVTRRQGDRTLAPGATVVRLDLGSIFTDPDGDTLTYEAASSDPVRLAVARHGAQVTLTPGSPGRAVVTLRATDPDGLSAVEAFTVTVAAGNRDYDSDDDGLIDVGTLAQLDAVRYDLDGDGLVDGATWGPYYAAFPLGALEMGCPGDGCTGYELTADLDFDTNGSGSADAGDAYWNAGAGWAPIGDEDARFTADFEGGGHTVANLFIDRSAEDGVGLFGVVGGRDVSRIRGVGLIGVDVTGRDGVGGLLGRGVYATVLRSHATGRVSGRNEVGGLAGRTWGALAYNYAAVDVSGAELVGGLVGHQILNNLIGSYATGSVSGTNGVGGLAGAVSDVFQKILASYATGDVSGRGARLIESDSGLIICDGLGFVTPAGPVEPTSSAGGGVGGLVGSSCGVIEASYATGAVSGTAAVGGLVGTASGLFVRSGYWDLETSGVRVGVGENDTDDNGVLDGAESPWLGVGGLTTAELQGPTDYTGVYATWNIDLNRLSGDGGVDDPWDFGTTTQYPALSMDVDDSGQATWQEFGYQLRDGPTLTAATTAGEAEVNLTWTAAGVSAWATAPEVTYTVHRDRGGTVATVADGLTALRYDDTGVAVGSPYRYRVAAVVGGGERARSAWVPVTAGRANQGPVPVGILADRLLEVGASAVEVDVAGAFHDPDDDPLAYTARSSATSVAAVSRSGSLVTITPGSAGVTLVTVTAIDTGGSAASATQRFTVRVGYDYDSDGDGLIEIETLAQLDAVRYDLNGHGRSDYVDGTEEAAAFAAAFPSALARFGCGVGGCSGYELLADLDFDTNGNGRADAGDAWWNDGAGWEPIGVPYEEFFGIPLGAFRATFEGNGHTLSNLFVDGGDYSGLFGAIRSSGAVRGVALIDVDVTGRQRVGGLVGSNDGVVSGSRLTGRVSGEVQVGGLAGANLGTVTHSRSSAAVTRMPPAGRWYPGSEEATGGLVGYNGGEVRSSHAAGRVMGDSNVGGLVGLNETYGFNRSDHARIVASYATGSVAGSRYVGGLAGRNGGPSNAPFILGEIHASYATGRVSSGARSVGGLFGFNSGGDQGIVTASYWDGGTSGHTAGSGARTTAQLQSPTGYSGIYAQWNADLDGDGANDDPWHFGTGSQYPVLKANVDGQGAATWQAFGYQLRSGPTLTATASATTSPGQAQVALTWTAVDAGHWDPAPGVTYTVTRGDGGMVEIFAENVAELRYTDPAAPTGTALTYQVAAVVDGGEPVRSAVVEVTTSGNAPPLPVGTLPDRWLRVGDAAGVEVGEAFEDPEDDALTYAVTSSATGVATVSMSGTRVSITPLAAGTATITVTATDAGGSGASAAQTFTVTVMPAGTTDYDADDDGLIEITTLAQLDAVRHDLNGDGEPTEDGAPAYAAAFATVGDRQACGGPTGCRGYELGADLDFDTNGNGRADAGDTYWNGGAGWEPLDRVAAPASTPGVVVIVFGGGFRATFEGNGHTIANLFIDRGSDAGLFGRTSSSSVIRHVGLIDVDVAGTSNVGGLVGADNGSVIGSYVTGTVFGTGVVGGLVGANFGQPLVASYAAVEVTGRTNVGGLVGENQAGVRASFATGRVSGERYVGGLVGTNVRLFSSGRGIGASYATGPVSGDSDVGGLVGRNQATVTASYWDATTSGQGSGAGGRSRTTAQLQAPTGHTGIYAQWNVDLDGDGTGDSPWHFGTDAQYPALAVDVDGVGGATWQEFGYQLRGGPTLTATATAGRNDVALRWTAADVSHWTPAPEVAYTVTRAVGTAVAVVGEALGGSSVTDTGAAYGRTHTYQVAAAVDGASTYSAPQALTVRGNRPPIPVGLLAYRTLPLGDGAVNVDVSDAFSDLENDALTYGAVSSAPDVATATAAGSTVTVTPVAAGTAVVIVSATDVGGSNTPAAQTFTVTVPNRSPVAKGSLSPLRLRVADGGEPVDVSGRFRDPDGDPLSYRAASSAESVARATVRGSTVTVTPVSGGTATVTVTATDVGSSNTSASQQLQVTVGGLDYDTDDDGLIEIRTPAQLDAVRHDPDGDGDPAGASAYAAAFTGADAGMGCGSGGCTGYELVADVDLDTDGSGGPGPADAYWNGGDGWLPIGTAADAFSATLEGNGHAVRNLFISRRSGAGLFGVTDASSVIRHVGVVGAAVAGGGDVGGLVGSNAGSVAGSYTTGTVSGTGDRVGGLAGRNQSTGDIRTSYSTARVSGNASVGGLVGEHDGALTAGYATGRVSGSSRVGGLVGRNQSTGSILAGYATAYVSGAGAAGGLVGAGSGTVSASYWDTSTSGRTAGAAGRTTAALQAPIGYTGIYSQWNVDLNGDAAGDAPWRFGTTAQYPVLAVDADGNGPARWQELGHQLRAGPTLTLTADGRPVALRWTAVDAGAWSPPPDVTYTVTRDDGTTVTVIGEALSGLTATDTVVPVGVTHTYQVAAVVDGGEAVRSAAVAVTGVPPNRPPVLQETLPARTLPIGGGAVAVDVSGAFRDPDGDPLIYGASSSAPLVAAASAAGSTVTVTPLAAGVATITVTATDAGGSGLSATQTFAVTVPNRAPVVARSLADRPVEVSDGVFMVDVSLAFRDPDGDPLTYGASSSGPSVASVTVAGSVVSVAPLSGGTATVTVTATDRTGSNMSAAQTFTVTVANRSPVPVATLSPLSLRVSTGARSVEVSNAFSDPDGDALTYGAWSSAPSVATVTATGSTVEVTPVSAGTATVTVTATDGGGSNTSATQTFEVTVANRSPVAEESLPALSLRVSERVRSVDVSGAFSDPDGDPLTYGASSSAPSVATVSVSGSTVAVRPVSAGTATVTVTATDETGSNTSATQTFEVTVANRSPVAEGSLAALSLRVADGAAPVEVSGAFSDPDGDPLTYGASSSAPSVARVSVSGSTVRVTPVSPGTAVVTVTATDRGGSNTSATQAFTVTVEPNAGPEAVVTLENKALDLQGGALPVDVAFAFRDPDGDPLTYAARSSDESVATVSVSGSTVTVRPVAVGTTTVTVTATDVDGSNTTATQTFRVTVAGNRSPEPVGSLPPLSLRVEDGAESVDVSGAFRDRDNDPLTYGASSSDGSVVGASATGETVTVTPVAGGTATVTVTAQDVTGSNTSATQTFAVTVANQSPEAVVTLPGVSLRVADGAATVGVALGFRDPDGDPLTYGARSSDGSVATASAAGSEVTVVPVSGGTATITVTARDVGGSNTTATQTVPVADAFEDPDRDVLSYGASSSDDSVATAVATGSTVRVTPFSSGTATVTVTAADAGGLRAEQAFEVTVANRSPARVGSLPALELQTAAGAVPVEVSGAFRDPDDDVLSYGATSSAVTVAAVTVSTSPSMVMVMVTPLSRGSATVTVTATDVAGSNTSATQAFGVRVDGGGGPGPGPGPGGPPGGGRNRAPQAVGTLADRTLEVGESLPVEVSGAFRDRDGDVLTYAADSSAAEVAAVSVSGGVVSVTALSVGEAEVTVTATDAEGSNRSAAQTFAVTVSHDADGDGLIGVHTLAQLDAVRHDVDGDGEPAAAGAAGYAAAFGATDSGAGTGTVRCPAAGGCRGYELGSDLDLDTNGSGAPDAGNAWWNGGAGWLPLGTLEAPFTTTFEGNGRRIRGLFVRGGDVAGLFGATGSSSVVRGVGVTAVDVTGGTAVGGLVGANAGTVTGSHATGRVSGSEAVGGLVGRNTGDGVVVGSYAAVEVSGSEAVGGLVGANAGGVAAVHAAGRVSGTRRVGGLVGYNRGALSAGYATGRVAGDSESGGLVGTSEAPGTVTDSFWDTDTSGRASGGSGDRAATAGRGLPTAALQAPVDYAGLYAAWSVDVDGDGAADAPWDFGTVLQYPALSLDVDGDGVAGWREVGRQLRAGPALTAAPAVDPARVDLTWTAADAGARTPAPEVTYTVHRETGAALETVATDVRGLRYVDRAVEPGSAYSYQVAAVVAGGEAARSALVPAAVPCAFLVAPLHRDVLWTAGTGEVSVSTGPACAWTAASGSEDFLTVTSDAAGTGSGTVTWAVEANAGVPREGALLVAGRRVTVYQASPTVFTDHPILPGATPVRAIHFRELRARINELRTGAGLPAFEWTDPTLTPGVTPVKRVHLTELRRALSEAYAATGRAGPAYRDALAAGGTVIGAAQMMELRAAVRALEAVRPPT